MIAVCVEASAIFFPGEWIRRFGLESCFLRSGLVKSTRRQAGLLFMTDPKTLIILGVPFHDVTMAETLEYIDALVSRRKPAYLATANLDFAAQASGDVELQRILFAAELVLCDGTPLVWASRWLQAPLRERVAGSDLLPHLFAHSAKMGHRIFFLGATDDVLEITREKCEADYPGIRICGCFAPPFAKLLDLDNEEIARRVREAKPDILLVAMGCPKQEKWIYMNYRSLGVPCSVGIGASLDFVAGKFKRAPVWMRVCGAEWIFRLLQEPRRLFNRYLFDLLFFVKALRDQKRALHNRPDTGPVATTVEKPAADGVMRYTWAGRIDAAAVDTGKALVAVPTEGRNRVLLDASQVTFMDSTGLGLLLKSCRRTTEAGGALVLVQPSQAVGDLLSAMKLDRYVPVAQDERSALALLETAMASHSDFVSGSGRLVVTFEGDITAATLAGRRETLETAWASRKNASQLQIDLQNVSFIDSSGLGLLVRARKLAQGVPGMNFSLVRPQPNVCNVIALANLQNVLPVEREEVGQV